MKNFAKKVFIFLIPFLFLVAWELYIDPFNYFTEEDNPKILALKESLSQKENPYLYKLIKFERHPTTTILLGDSRTELLKSDFFKKYDSENVTNLSIGGGTVQDAIEIYNYVSAKNTIKKIYWGISIETYSGTRLRNRATQSIDIKKSFLLYLLNRYTFSSAMLISRSLIFNEKIELYKPKESKDEFWKSQLELDSRYLSNYSYPDNYYSSLKKIAQDCIKNNIKLVFIIPPGHIDLQNMIHKYQLDEEYEKFKSDLSQCGDVFDFNHPNELTKDKNNFKDPFHFHDSIAEIIINEITSGKAKYSKYISHNRGN